MDIFVLADDRLRVGDKEYRCTIGKEGFIAPEEKREGDMKTPTGIYPLREVWYRADKIAAPQTGLPVKAIQEADGWCDDPAHTAYNMHISRPFNASHEVLWRQDDCYNLIVPIGYNDNPPVAGRGSAIFMHLAKPDYSGTQGCVALALKDVLAIVSLLDADSLIHILPENHD